MWEYIIGAYSNWLDRHGAGRVDTEKHTIQSENLEKFFRQRRFGGVLKEKKEKKSEQQNRTEKHYQWKWKTAKPAKAITWKSQSNEKKSGFHFFHRINLVFFLHFRWLTVAATTKILCVCALMLRMTSAGCWWNAREIFQQLALPRTDLVNMKRNNRRMFHPLEIIMWMASVFAIVCPIKLVHMEKRWDQWPTWCYQSVSRNIHMHNNQV